MARYRLNNVTFTPGTRQIDTGMTALALKDLTLIVNSTSGVTICNVGMKSTIESVTNGIVTYKAQTEIMLPSGVTKTVELAALCEGDELYVEVDFGGLTPADALNSEVIAGKEAITNAIVAKGGTAQSTENFSQLAQDVTNIPVIAKGGVTFANGYTAGNLDDVLINAYRYVTDIVNNTLQHTYQLGMFSNMSGLKNVTLNALLTDPYGYMLSYCDNLENVSLPNLLTSVGYMFRGCNNLENVSLPNCTQIGSNFCITGKYPKHLDISSYINMYANIIFSTGDHSPMISVKLGAVGSQGWRSINQFGTVNMRDFWILDGDNNINLYTWTATNVIAEGQSGIDELNENFMNHIVANLRQGLNKTITIGATLYAVITEEVKQAIIAKGWNLASA